MYTRKYDWKPGEHGDEYLPTNLPDGVSATVGLHVSGEYWCWEVGIRGAYGISGESSSAQDCIRQVEEQIAKNLQYVDADDKGIPYGPTLLGDLKVGQVNNTPSKPLPIYRVIATAHEKPMNVERDLNQLAKEGYRVVAIMPDGDTAHPMIIMERFEDANSLDVFAELGRRAALEDNKLQLVNDLLF